MESAPPMTWRLSVALDAWVLLLASVLVRPLLSTAGHPLARDLVFTPVQPFRLEWLGLGDTPARAVPLDAVVSLADAVVGGAVLGRLAVLGVLVLAGAAAHRVLSGAHPVARLAAAGFAVWNPFVVERLALGQWALLAGYAALFAVIPAAARFRDGTGGWVRVAPVVAALLPAALTPTGALLGAGTALVVGCRRRAGVVVPLFAAAGAVQLPWLLPSLVGGAGALSDPRAVDAFAARGERPLGALWSLLGLGGIWDSGSVPASRGGALGHLTSLVVLVCLVVGWPALRRLLGRATASRIAVLGVAGLLVAASTATPLGADLARWLVVSVPGAGLLRDAQKWLIPFVVLSALAFGAVADSVARRVRLQAPSAMATAAVVLVGLPPALLPDALSVTWPTVRPVTYPADFAAVAAIVDGSREAMVSLPWQPYRRFAWASPLPVYDPASRWFDVDVVMSDRLQVGTALLAGESARSARVQSVLSDSNAGPDLASAGVRWVLIQRGEGTGAADPAGQFLTGSRDAVTTRFAGAYLVLLETTGPWAEPADPALWKVVLVGGVDALLVVLGAVAVGLTARAGYRRRWRLPAGMLHRTQRGS